MELGAVARRPELSLWYHQQYCSPGVKTCYLILIADTRLSSLIVIQRCSLPRFGRLLLLLEVVSGPVALDALLWIVISTRFCCCRASQESP
jgi:hypothetical protein